MKDRIDYIRREVNTGREEVDYARREFQKLQELCGEVQAIWRDEAAQEINVKYLEPCSEEDRRALAELDRQNLALEEAKNHLLIADDHIQTISQLTIDINHLIETTEQEISKAEELQNDSEKLASLAEISAIESTRIRLEAESIAASAKI